MIVSYTAATVRRVIGIAVATTFALTLAKPSTAQYGHPVAGAGLSDAEIARRLSFIEERLDSHRIHARAWFASWLAINGLSAIGLGIAAGLSDSRVDRANFGAQACLATVGVLDLTVVRGPPALHGADPIRALPGQTHAERLQRLERAEELLERGARRERFRFRWEVQLANLLFNGAAAALVAGLGDSQDALITGLSGWAAGQLYLLSEPWGRDRDLRDYERLTGQRARMTLGVSLSPTLRGLELRFAF